MAERLGLNVHSTTAAGGGSLADDRETLAALTRSTNPVVVLVPAWEPPLLEFVDFLGLLRRAAGTDASIIVMPVGENGEPPAASERETWSRAVARSGDSRAYVETGDL